jgi:hypothetical protein
VGLVKVMVPCSVWTLATLVGAGSLDHRQAGRSGAVQVGLRSVGGVELVEVGFDLQPGPGGGRVGRAAPLLHFRNQQ